MICDEKHSCCVFVHERFLTSRRQRRRLSAPLKGMGQDGFLCSLLKLCSTVRVTETILLLMTDYLCGNANNCLKAGLPKSGVEKLHFALPPTSPCAVSRTSDSCFAHSLFKLIVALQQIETVVRALANLPSGCRLTQCSMLHTTC